jgi:hypothetical protein
VAAAAGSGVYAAMGAVMVGVAAAGAG